MWRAHLLALPASSCFPFRRSDPPPSFTPTRFEDGILLTPHFFTHHLHPSFLRRSGFLHHCTLFFFTFVKSHSASRTSVPCPFLADITCHYVSLCRSLISVPPPSLLFPSATRESTWDPGIFIIIIIIFPSWWLTYNKHFISLYLALQPLQGYICYKAICPQCKALGVAGSGSQFCEHQVHLSYCNARPGPSAEALNQQRHGAFVQDSVTLSERVLTVVAAVRRFKFAGLVCSSMIQSDCMHAFTLTHRHTHARAHTPSSTQPLRGP